MVEEEYGRIGVRLGMSEGRKREGGTEGEGKVEGVCVRKRDREREER